VNTCDTTAHIGTCSKTEMAHAALVDAVDAATSTSINFFGSEDDFLSEDLFNDIPADAGAKKQRKDRVEWIRMDGMYTKSLAKAKLLVRHH
jgi:hypothetical protein